MPKVKSPNVWAYQFRRTDEFRVADLNEVVSAYGKQLLIQGDRRSKQSSLGRLGYMASIVIVMIGLVAPGVGIGFFISGGGGRRFSQDFTPGVEVPVLFVGFWLGVLALLLMFINWVREPYRQFYPNLIMLPGFLAVCGAAMLVLLYRSDADVYQRWPLSIPMWVLLFGATLFILSVPFLRAQEQPAPLDLKSLDADQVAVLSEARREALEILRKREIIDSQEFEFADSSSLTLSKRGV